MLKKNTKGENRLVSFLPPAQIDLIVFDFDGVFTDNKVYTAQDGTEAVICDRRDGLGIDMLKRLNIPMFILSTETNPIVIARGKKMGLRVDPGCEDKKLFLENYLEQNRIKKENVIYVGNDLNDLEVMEMVGFAVCPNDAHLEIKNIASYVLNMTGGNGAVRELAELIIQKKQGDM